MDLFTHETRTLKTLAEKGYTPAIIYDIGASNGVWSDTIALTVPQAEYYLFEPLAEAVQFYQHDLQERLSRRPNFHLHIVALSDHSGVGEFFLTHDAWGSSMLDRGAIPEVKEIVPVPLSTLDEFVDEYSLPLPNVMKIDVQGAERLILTGASRVLPHLDVLFLETWLKRGYGPSTPLLPEIIEFLEYWGFGLMDFGDQIRDERRRIYSVDAVFFSERLLSKA
jgi:FkbM family methyltransferase